MIFIFTAFHAEAKPLIEHFQLKKTNHPGKFQVFANDKITLVVSGTGIVQAAVAASHILTERKAGKQDIFINIGICGVADSRFHIGDAVLCHKVIQHDSKRTFYPDMLIEHEFHEGTLESFSVPVDEAMRTQISGELVDMEGAGCVEAAFSFLAPHQIFVLKIVSDALRPDAVIKDDIAKPLEKHLPAFARLLDKAQQLTEGERDQLNGSDRQMIDRIGSKLRLSATMKHQLEQWAKQYVIRTGSGLAAFYSYSEVPVNSKQEGKILFAKLKKELVLD